MTVCIAAICQGPTLPDIPGAGTPTPMIVAASDRMISSGDIQFEHQQSKYFQFSPSVGILLAGDYTAQISICQRSRARFSGLQPTSVEEVANTYAEELQTYRRTLAEAVYLKPIGLDAQSFIYRQSEMAANIVADLINKLIDYPIDVSALIIGRDALGHHIYVVTDPGVASCHDGVGFASIGSGHRHANLQFMVAGYSQWASIERALSLTYRAKKRAEVSPGVGRATDMYVVTDTFSLIEQRIHDKIQTIHRETEEELQTVLDKSEANIRGSLYEFLRDVHAQQQKSPQTPFTESPPAPETT